MVSSLLDRLAIFVTTHRWGVVASLVGLTALFALQIPSIQADFTPSDLFATFEDQEEIADRFRETYGNTDNVLMVLVRGDDVLSESSLDYVHRLSRAMARQEAVSRVESVTVTQIPRMAEGADSGGGVFGMLQRMAAGGPKVEQIVSGDDVSQQEAQRLEKVLADAPLIEGRLISQDRTLTAVTVFFERELTQNADIEQAVREVESWVDEHAAPEGYETLLAGLPYVRLHVIRRMQADQTVMLPAAIIVSLLLLLAAFRWLPAMLLPMVAVGMSTVMIIGGMAWYGEPFNIINNIVPLLVIVIGISDAIHLINRFGEEYAVSRDREEASRATLRSMAAACFLTSFTTAAGFGSLMVSQTEILGRFGATAALGVLGVYIVTIAFLPAMLTLVAPPKRLAEQATTGRVEAWAERMVGRLLEHRQWVLIAGAVVAVVCTFSARGLTVDNAVLDQLDEEDPVYKTTKLIERKLYGVRPLEVSFRSSKEGRLTDPAFLNNVEELARWARTKGGVLRTTSPNDFLQEAWYLMTGDPEKRTADYPSRQVVDGLHSVYQRAPQNPLNSYMTKEGDGVRLSISLTDMGAKQTIALAEKLQSKAQALFGEMEDVEIHLTGDAYVGSLGLDIVIRDLMWSLGTAFLIIFLFMSLVLGSVRLGLLSIPPNVFPLLMTMAYMAWQDIPLNTATAVIFSISIGLAVDGTIHLLARFREEVAHGDQGVDEALVRSARGTGKAIILTYVALMVGFSVMFWSSFVPVRRFGELISVTVLGCLAATLLFVPPLLKVGWPDQ
jgi:predicted RND superfamily exporter protein